MAAADSTDVLVIGGGPAGLATAIESRLAGFETLVIDRRRPPIDVACGEGLMPIGVERLRDLGVQIPESESSVFRGIRYLDGAVVAEARFRNGFGLGVRRTVLHEAMRGRAEELGTRFAWGVEARGLSADGVDTKSGLIRSRWVVAADGRMSRIRALAGLSGKVPRRRRLGVRRHYRLAPWSDFVEVYWANGAEAYVTPVGDGLVGVAMLTHEAPIDFDQLLESFPSLRQRLSRGRVASRDRGAGPFGHRPHSVSRGNLALVGDASGSLDPITGEGLSVAFAQAHYLIQSIQRGNLAEYDDGHRLVLRIPRILTSLLLVAERRPWVRRQAVRVLASLPRLFDRVVELAASGRSGAETPRFRETRQATRI
jgi:flavin-dependent dehydrogenase